MSDSFAARWKDALYNHVAVQAGAPQMKVDLSRRRDEDRSVYSDVLLHLPVLEWFASQCEHVTEFGVRDVQSTLALLSGARKKVVSYDVERTPAVDAVLALEDLPVPWEFHQRSSTAGPIAPTDMLFIDSEHTGKQVALELSMHWGCVRRFVALHDTSTFWGRDGYGEAISSFLADRGELCRLVYQTRHNNGLMVVEKCTQTTGG